MGVFGHGLWCCPSSVGCLWCSWLGQREGGTPGWTVDKQEGQDSEHPTTLGGEKKRGEKREREETENPHPEEHLWAYSIEEENKKKVKIQVTFEVSRELWETGDTEARVIVGQGIYDGLLDFWRSSQAKRRHDDFVEFLGQGLEKESE